MNESEPHCCLKSFLRLKTLYEKQGLPTRSMQEANDENEFIYPPNKSGGNSESGGNSKSILKNELLH